MSVFNFLEKKSLMKKALKLFNQSKYQETLECYDKITSELDPTYINAWYEKGRVYHKLKDYENALIKLYAWIQHM